MREQQQLVPGVEAHEIAGAQRGGAQLAQPPVRKHALDERFAQFRIAQATFFLERQQRLRVGETRGEETAASALPAPDSP